MSVKKDPSGRRWVAAEVEVPGTPEEVWQAIATGPGVSSWFVPTEIREDGKVVSTFGPGMEAVASQTDYEPPHRFAAEGELGPGAPKLATEWIVEARSGGKCLVRVVHSLFASTDDWDDQLENIEKGWPDFFEILRLYLTHFGGQPCAAFQLMGMAPEPAGNAWKTLTASLGLEGVAVGERFQAAGAGPQFAGVVERGGQAGHPDQLLVRLDEPAPGLAHLYALAMGGMVFVPVRFYLYGEHARAAAADLEGRFQAWMNEHFPMPGQASPSC